MAFHFTRESQISEHVSTLKIAIVAPLNAYAEAKDTDTDASGSQNAVADIEEKPPSNTPLGEDDTGPTSTEDDIVRTVHGIKVCTTGDETLGLQRPLGLVRF